MPPKVDKACGTSPRVHAWAVSARTRLPTTTTTRPSALLALPLELVGVILDLTFLHPDEDSRKRDDSDSRSHGWVDCHNSFTFAILKRLTATYHSQLHALLSVCKTFYRHVLPKLYAAPVLITPGSVAAFAKRAPLVPLLGTTPVGALLQRLSLHPHSSPPALLVKSWAKHLAKILSHAPNLTALALGQYTEHLPLDSLLPLTSAPSRIRSLNKLSLHGSRETNAEAVSLIARCPAVDTLSFAALNLLDGSANAVYTIDKMLDASPADVSDDEDETAWTLLASRSVWSRFREALILRERCGGVGQRGMRSLFLWQLSVVTTSTLWEILELTQHLECLHLDAYSLLAPSAKSSPLYDALMRNGVDVARLIERFAELELRELTFSPLLTDGLTIAGNFDRLLTACPALTHLELRADHVSPQFFSTLLRAHSLDYLGLHVLPPHGPRLANDNGRQSICTSIFVFLKDDIEELAEAIEDLGPCGWPRGDMERDDGDDSGWYEVLCRCASGRRDL